MVSLVSQEIEFGRRRQADMSALSISGALPSPISARPGHSPFDLHAISIPAGSFTGDFYFARQFDREIWIALGDVAGKGLEAAIFMAMIHEELEARVESCSTHGCDPSTTMSRLHEVLRQTLPANRFATAVVARLRDDGTLLLSNAGHCPPLLLRAASGSIEELGSTGPALGILPQPAWRTTSARLQRGDALFLYTDGLIEAQSLDEEELGLSCARSSLQSLGDNSARAIAGAFRDLAARHSGGHRYDDLTLLALRYNP
jgi:sigma-B regulation protein RsbU (phosphoserine phosphatase)